MKSLKLLILFIPLAIASCATIAPKWDPPHVSLAGLEIKELGLFEQRFVLRLRMQNPNNATLPISGMNYKLFINDQLFARGVSNQSLKIQPFEEVTVDVESTSTLSSLLEQLGGLGKQSGPQFKYRLEGNVGVLNSSIKIPFQHIGELGLPHRGET